MASARDVVLHEWSLRRPVQLDTSGGWHKCSRQSCNIIHLKEYVCISHQHVVAAPRCDMHDSACVLVNDLYVCQQVGCAHTCDQRTCHTVSGRCSISGLSCVETTCHAQLMQTASKRTRRRSPNVHTCHQAANILLYDLLFSNRRVASELHRMQGVLDVARRLVQRSIRKSVQKNTLVSYQSLVNIFTEARLKINNTSHIISISSEDSKRQVCEFYAAYIIRIWNMLVQYMPVRTMFEPIAAALLYGMRRGIAYDGLLAVPLDRFLACALPDAHAIKDVDINRRLFTQSKNALFVAIQQFVRQKGNHVEMIAAEFRTTERPDCLEQYSNGSHQQR